MRVCNERATAVPVSMFGWGGSKKRDSKSSAQPGDGFDMEDEVYQAQLPPTMPVVKKTVDTLVELAVKQRMFLSSHADKLKLELVKERASSDLKTGAWYLNGFSLSDEDAIDLVRASPDTLSNLVYTNYTDTTSIWAKLTSWLRFGAKDSRLSRESTSLTTSRLESRSARV